MTRLAISRPTARARLWAETVRGDGRGCWCFWIVGRCAASGDDHDAESAGEERDQDVVSGWARVGHEALKQEGENNKRIGSIATLAMATVTEIEITAERQNDLSECTRPFQKALAVLRALSLAHPLPSVAFSSLGGFVARERITAPVPLSRYKSPVYPYTSLNSLPYTPSRLPPRTRGILRSCSSESAFVSSPPRAPKGLPSVFILDPWAKSRVENN